MKQAKSYATMREWIIAMLISDRFRVRSGLARRGLGVQGRGASRGSWRPPQFPHHPIPKGSSSAFETAICGVLRPVYIVPASFELPFADEPWIDTQYRRLGDSIIISCHFRPSAEATRISLDLPGLRTRSDDVRTSVSVVIIT